MNLTLKVGADVTCYEGLDSANFARAQEKAIKKRCKYATMIAKILDLV